MQYFVAHRCGGTIIPSELLLGSLTSTTARVASTPGYDLRTTADSGASEKVVPDTLVPDARMSSSNGRQEGAPYLEAGECSMPNGGEKAVKIASEEGQLLVEHASR